jgi:hypothetical protein
MNARCYRCGWSFSLSRETIAAAVAAADAQGDTYHVEPCPKCKQAIKLPLDQLRRALPPGWKPEAAAAPAEEPTAPPASEEVEPANAPAEKAKPHHRRGARKAE